MKKVTVVIPCLNEEAGIGDVIRGFPREQLSRLGYELEVMVIDNNSTDRTSEVAQAAGARVILETKPGKGNAMVTGFYNLPADTDYVVMLDGDDTYRPEEIMRLLEPITSGFCSVIIGSRLGGRISSGSMSEFNRMGNWVFSHLVRYFYRVNVTDVLTGYFAWSREAIEKLRPHLKSPGFAIEMEMITRMARLGEDIYSVPISYNSRAGESSLSPIGDGSRILRMFVRNLMWKPKMERIAFVSDAIMPFHKGGKEKRLYEVAKRLVRDGREVHIYTMKWWDGPKTLFMDGMYLHAICRLHPLYHGQRRSFKEAIFFGLATLKLIFAKFDTMDVDSMPFFPLFSARLVCWLRHKRMYATWHEVTGLATWQNYIGVTAGMGAWWIEKLAQLTPDEIISNSQHTTERLRADGVRKPIKTVPLGVDLDNIYAIEPSADESDVIYAGRLLAHKNIDLLVRAIALVKTDKPDILCRIVGAGPEKPRITELISELGLEPNIRLTNHLEDPADLYSLMKASKMFVLPSVREGFSLVVIEAFASGIPVVTTKHPDNAARDLVKEGVNGYFTELNAEAIARQIVNVLQLESKMRPNEDIGQYDWKAVAKRIDQVLSA